MEFSELIVKRQSCRQYSTHPVGREKITACLEAARLSPSACNSQPWHFYVVDREPLRSSIAEQTQGQGMNRFTANCPVFIVVTEETATLMDTVRTKHDSQAFAANDIGIAVAHLCLAATDQGLATCIMGWFAEDKIKELLSLSAAQRVRLIVALGYDAREQLRPKRRKPLAEIVTFIDD